jgi:hypothetical protein
VLEGIQKIEPVLVGLEDSLSLVTPGGDMIQRRDIRFAGGRDKNIRGQRESQNIQYLTLRYIPGSLLYPYLSRIVAPENGPSRMALT